MIVVSVLGVVTGFAVVVVVVVVVALIVVASAVVDIAPATPVATAAVAVIG